MDRTAWDKAYAAYLSAKMVYEAAEAFGPGELMERGNRRDEYALEAKYGKRNRQVRGSEGDLAFDAMENSHESERDKYCGEYYDPYLNAAEALAFTPAPDWQSLRIKMEIIKEVGVHQYHEGTIVFDAFAADAKRLAA